MAILLPTQELITEISISAYSVSLQPGIVSIQICKIEKTETEILRITPVEQIHVQENQDPVKFLEYKTKIETSKKEILFAELLAKYEPVK
jgi:hypothetical protein